MTIIIMPHHCLAATNSLLSVQRQAVAKPNSDMDRRRLPSVQKHLVRGINTTIQATVQRHNACQDQQGNKPSNYEAEAPRMSQKGLKFN
jgi:hypothetical protein